MNHSISFFTAVYPIIVLKNQSQVWVLREDKKVFGNGDFTIPI